MSDSPKQPIIIFWDDTGVGWDVRYCDGISPEGVMRLSAQQGRVYVRAGENINTGDRCYVAIPDGLLYRASPEDTMYCVALEDLPEGALVEYNPKTGAAVKVR